MPNSPRTHLPWYLLGRQVKPFSLALSLACLTIGWLILGDRTTPSAITGSLWADVIAVVALLACALLWVGFWVRSDLLMRHGLLLAAGAWMARAAAVAVLDGPLTQTASLSACWALAAAGAWLLESAWSRRGGA